MRVQSQFIEMFGNTSKEMLGKFIQVIRGVSYKPSDVKTADDPDTAVILRSNNINDANLNTDEVVYIDKNRVSGDQYLRINDIVVCASNGSKALVGKAAINKTLTNQYAHGAFCLLVRPNDNINHVYLNTFFQTSLYKKQIDELAAGSNILNIKQEHLTNMILPLPIIEEQNKFAIIAEQADKSKFVGFKSQFIEMFGNPLSSKHKNELKKLGECCCINPRRPNITLHDTDKVSFVPMSAVSEDGHLLDILDEEYGKVKKGFTYFENNDVLFAKITPCMENGKGAIAQGLTNGIGMGSTEFHVLRPINEISSPYWLLALTQMPVFRERAAKNMSGTGGQKRVAAAYLEHFMVGVPSIEEQRHFEAIYKQADKSKYNN